jgi:hypothetical protein
LGGDASSPRYSSASRATQPPYSESEEALGVRLRDADDAEPLRSAFVNPNFFRSTPGGPQCRLGALKPIAKERPPRSLSRRMTDSSWYSSASRATQPPYSESEEALGVRFVNPNFFRSTPGGPQCRLGALKPIAKERPPRSRSYLVLSRTVSRTEVDARRKP